VQFKTTLKTVGLVVLLHKVSVTRNSSGDEIANVNFLGKSAISLQRGHFDPKFQVQGVAPTNHFCTVRPINALQLYRWQFSHKETL